MTIKENICPRCGNPSPHGEVCDRCQTASTRWMVCEPRVQVTECPSCGARKEGGTWTDIPRESDELAREVACRGIHLHPDLKDQVLEISIQKLSSNRSFADCRAGGSLHGVPVTDSCRIEISWIKEQCDRCNRISGSYHEGVVQIRADGRKPALREIESAARIAQDTEGALQAAGERMSFISSMKETRDGLDITVGSQRIGQEISTAIVQQMGGRCTTHPKLIGEKAGRKLFRITYSLRLPRFTRGDIIRIGNRYAEVLHDDGKTVRYSEIPGGNVKSQKEDRIEGTLGNISDALEYLVAYLDGDIIGLIEPESGRVRECAPGVLPGIRPGSYVRVMRDGETLLVVGRGCGSE